MIENTIEKLNSLSELKASRSVLLTEWKAAQDQAMPPEIKSALQDIDSKFVEQLNKADEQVETLETQIKAEVLDEGQTVTGDSLMAVWSKGRVSWADKELQGYLIDHPEIGRFRIEGSPSVSIRARR
jgi:hypothetical protein